MMLPRLFTLLLATLLTCPTLTFCDQSYETLVFKPPSGWYHAKSAEDSPYIKLFIVGKAKKSYPPSINICVEPFTGTLADYMKHVQRINRKEGGVWKGLGSLQTPAGKGNLSQLDIITQYGPLRMLHFILVEKGRTYIFTAAAKRDEFAFYYKDFFAAIRSLEFGKAVAEISQTLDLTSLKSPVFNLLKGWIKNSDSRKAAVE